MLNSQQVRRIKGVLVASLLIGLGYFGVNYNEYLKAKKTEYRWFSEEDSMGLSYRPISKDAYVVLAEEFVPGPKHWKADFSLPKPGSWNSFFIDRLLKIPDPNGLYLNARVEEMQSRLTGLLKAALYSPPDRMSPLAMDAIVRLALGGDPNASSYLDRLLTLQTAPRERMLAIKAMARSRKIQFDTDAEYEAWFQKVILPRAFKAKESRP